MDSNTVKTDIGHRGASLTNAEVELTQQNISHSKESSEPNVWRAVGRLAHESIYIIFFIGTHWAIKWWLVKTHQEQEWWAKYLLNISIAFAVAAFTVIFGVELIVDCKRAIQYAYKELWKER
jgi:hypothetical protein